MKKDYTMTDGETVELSELYANLRREERREKWREKKRKDKSLDYLCSLGIEFPDKSVSIEADYILKEERGLLYSAIAKLEPRQKELLLRHFFNEESLKDIAAEQGVSYQAIQERLRKIIDKLRKLLL